MKHDLKYILPFVIALFTACNNNQKMGDAKPQNAFIFPQGEIISNNNFKGTAYLQILIEADSLNSISVGNVTFEPGARSNWHLHPAGQILLVTDGVGYYQEKGQPKKILFKGDVIKCPPNMPHWHGAGSDEAFVQIAITGREKGPTVWLEPVTDEEYNSFNK
jgi:quercetin dioxygenase-like cupin family protein